MKRFLGLLSIFAVIMSLAGCAANSTTGQIVVTNLTSTAVTNAKVGSVYIGYVGPGASNTIYFYTAESNAQVSADGFSVDSPTIYKGTIDLKLNYSYTLSFYDNTGSNVYNIGGTKIGGKSTDSDYSVSEK